MTCKFSLLFLLFVGFAPLWSDARGVDARGSRHRHQGLRSDARDARLTGRSVLRGGAVEASSPRLRLSHASRARHEFGAGILEGRLESRRAPASAQEASAARPGGALSFDVTDGRSVITRDMGRNLLLRVVKEKSVNQEHYGWRVEVVRRPYRRSSRNLLYHSRRTVGAHPSQVYAWHVTSAEFPNERELHVWGYPLAVRVTLINPVTEGAATDGRFVSGTIKITWGRKETRSPPHADGDGGGGGVR